MIKQFDVGSKGTVVGVGQLDRSKEKVFERKDKVDRIQSMNNFEFDTNGFVTVHRAYKIGSGKVRMARTTENVWFDYLEIWDKKYCKNLHKHGYRRGLFWSCWPRSKPFSE